VTRHFATKASRFRLAVLSGFGLVTLGALVVGGGLRYGQADLFWGGMSFPSSGGETPSARPLASPQYYAPHRAAHLRPHSPKLRFAARVHVGTRGGVGAGRSMCVRLCDGFAFPVGDYHGEGDRVAHEATCQKECPGAATALFVVPSGADSISDAREVGSGRLYSQLPDAFHYTTFVEEACSCHPQAGSRIASLLHDFTLRRGDAVMTSRGMRIFHGASRYPYQRRDFVALSQSRDVRKTDRSNLQAMERASLIQPTVVAQGPQASPTPHQAIEHQARN
jgi:hypothetical protein